MRPNQARRLSRRRGFSLIELLVVIAIMVILLSIAVPSYISARQNMTETAVISEIRTIHAAQAAYLGQFNTFATALAQLGPPVSGGPGPAAAGLIPASLASGEKDGYRFVMTVTPQGYTINANPKIYNSTGRRTFYSDQTMTIHQNWSAEPANTSSPELQ